VLARAAAALLLVLVFSIGLDDSRELAIAVIGSSDAARPRVESEL